MNLANAFRSSPRVLALLIVATWLVLAAAYCYFHGYVALNGTPDVGFSVKWALHSWGAWLALGPLLVGLWHDRNLSSASTVASALAALALAVGVVLAIDRLADNSITLPQRLYWSVPQSSALLAILLVGELLRRQWAYRAEKARRPPGKIEINTGDARALVSDDQIRWIGADGNYVEVSDGRHRGRLRCTLSQIAADLPDDRFHRVHRSFLVNIDFIDRIEAVPGTRNTRVHLQGDSRSIPASRRGLESLRNRLSL